MTKFFVTLVLTISSVAFSTNIDAVIKDVISPKCFQNLSDGKMSTYSYKSTSSDISYTASFYWSKKEPYISLKINAEGGTLYYGIVVTNNPGLILKSVDVYWNKDKSKANHKLSIYSHDSSFTGTAMLYKKQLKLVNELSHGTNEVQLNEKYKYIGIRPSDLNQAYVDSITFIWEDPNEVTTIESLHKLNDCENGDKVKIDCPVTVAYANESAIFATDKNDWIQIKATNSYKKNDIIPTGWTAEYVVTNGVPTLTNCEGLETSVSSEELIIDNITEPLTSDDVNKVVALNEVVIDGNPDESGIFNGTFKDHDILLSNKFGSGITTTGIYDMTAVVGLCDNEVIYDIIRNNFSKSKMDFEHELSDDILTINAVHPSLDLYYRFIPESDINVKAENTGLDGYTKMEHNDNGYFEIPIEDNGVIKAYTYHEPSNTCGTEQTITVKKETSTGVDDVTSDNTETIYYNLQGIKVDKTIPGQVYIAKTGLSTYKVLIR